jgi:signal transduction histidine kinase
LDELNLFLDAAALVHSTLDLAEVLERAAQRAAQACGARRCTILLLAKDGETLLPGASQFEDVDDFALVSESKEIHQAIREQRPVFIPDASASSLPRRLIESCDAGSVLLAPLVGEERVIGLLALDRAEKGREFTTGKVDLALAIGAQAATAIANARLYEQARRRIAELDAELVAVNKEMEALTYAISHDLRAPLRHIDGFSRLLLTDYEQGLDRVGQDYLQRVRAASQLMKQFVDDLLKLSRLSRREMHRERVVLSDLAREIGARLRAAQPEREVEFIVRPGLVVEGDTYLLEVVLENLLDNAWKFTSKQACARIEFDYTRGDARPVYFVRDDGVGFDATYADKLFGVFQRLHSTTEFEGVGMGLAIVQRIIHRHGGQVWAESTVGQGATFYFTLP